MGDPLQRAREIAERLRFANDLPTSTEADDVSLDRVRSSLLLHGLKLSADVTPNLARGLEKVCNRLEIPASVMEAFVFPSSEIQAESFVGNRRGCIIRFSSSLVELLDEEEFEFVAGHEIGHFLLRHRLTNQPQHSIEYFMRQRYQEISVDRIGLVGCASLQAAMRALMKVASGLSERHLRYDVRAFISQMNRNSEVAPGAEASSHPPSFVRCRALLWFSMSDGYARGADYFREEQHQKLDRAIDEEIKRFVDGPARERISSARLDVGLWTAAGRIVRKGRFTKSLQQVLAVELGPDRVERLRLFLSDLSEAEAEKVVDQRTREAREALETLVPLTFADEIKSIEDMVQATIQTS